MSGAQQSRKSRPAQRWPDIMVGVVTLALLAGFGTLVFGERNRPLVTQTPPAQPATPVIPSSPGTVPEPQPVPPAATTTATPPATTSSASGSTAASGNNTSAGSGTSETTGTTPSATSTATTTQTSSSSTTSQALDPSSSTAPTPAQPDTATTTTPGLAQTSEIPPAPTAPPVEPIKPPVLPETPAPQPQATTPATQPPATQPTTQQPAATTPATPAVPARAGGAVATSENRVPLRSDYRISLGSFTTRKTVESQTASVRGLGYNVHAIDLGDQYVAQIGPFASEAEAQRALADIQRADPGALLYRPRNATTETTTPSSTQNTTPSTGNTSTSTSTTSNTTPAAPTTETTPARPQAAAPSGPTYIQVGAFDREESAQRLVGILHDNGFNPTVNSPEGRKTTVMVGPYSGDAVLRAEARLDNAGLEHFRVR